MPDSSPEQLIDQYFAGTLDPETAERVGQYLEATPWRRGVMTAVHVAMRGDDLVTVTPEVIAAAETQFFATLNASREVSSLTKSKGWPATWRHASHHPARRTAAYLTASLLAMVAILGGLKFIPRPMSSAETAPVHYATSNGQRAKITLSDGTTVMLNVASRLDVPVDYARGNHTVQLTGEALFVAAHHTTNPLTVIAGPVTARVLGTSFIVRHYATDTTATVAVRDGKVVVRSSVVAAWQQAIVPMRGGAIHLRAADAAQFRFATGILELNGVSLRNAIPELNRWYNADIRLADPGLAALQVTGEFEGGSLSALTEPLALTFNLRIVRDGRVVTLYPR